jgi:protein-S-isoprenylcysteine O-methyltransferase Ste14
MITRLLVRTAIWLTGMALLLFVPAGTIYWPAAWVFIAISAVSGVGIGLWFAKHDPELLAARMGPMFQRGQSTADKILVALLLLAVCGWFVVTALDAGRNVYWQMPMLLRVAGAAAIIACMYVAFLTMRANTFASPVVRVQTERDQRVIDTGPYAIVRHPMYAGAIFYFIGVPLLLSSWIGLACVPILAAIFAVRIVLEENTLRAGLPGYPEYTQRVRWRLLPGVW